MASLTSESAPSAAGDPTIWEPAVLSPPDENVVERALGLERREAGDETEERRESGESWEADEGLSRRLMVPAAG